jgi:hypothetical protein
MASFQYVILISSQPDRLAEFEHWYDTVHLPDVVAVPGVVSAKRYRLLHNFTDEYETEPAPWHSLALYELETDDPKEVALEIKRRARTGEMRMSDSVVQAGSLKMVAQFSAAFPPAAP